MDHLNIDNLNHVFSFLNTEEEYIAVTIGNLRNFQKTSETYKRNQNQS